MFRPRLVTWLALAVLILSAANLLQAAQAWLRAGYLAGLETSIPPTYLGLNGLIWGITLGAAVVGLWRMRPWGRWLALGAISLFLLHTWVNRLVFDRSVYARQLWPGEAVTSLLGLALTWVILWLPRVRAAFERRRRTRS